LPAGESNFRGAELPWESTCLLLLAGEGALTKETYGLDTWPGRKLSVAGSCTQAAWEEAGSSQKWEQDCRELGVPSQEFHLALSCLSRIFGPHTALGESPVISE